MLKEFIKYILNSVSPLFLIGLIFAERAISYSWLILPCCICLIGHVFLKLKENLTKDQTLAIIKEELGLIKNRLKITEDTAHEAEIEARAALTKISAVTMTRPR